MPQHKMEVHIFESTRKACNCIKAEGNIKDGDILVVPSEGVVGFLYKAWPVAVVYPGWSDSGEDPDAGSFHIMSLTHGDNPDHPAVTHARSVQKCLGIAEQDADITGNEHWKNVQ